MAGGSRSTGHWEGGAGCRDKTRMSNKDAKKHKGSKLKTNSQKHKRVGQKFVKGKPVKKPLTKKAGGGGGGAGRPQ